MVFVTGSSGPCPDTNTNPPHLTPWAIGDSVPSEKPVLGALFVKITSGSHRLVSFAAAAVTVKEEEAIRA